MPHGCDLPLASHEGPQTQPQLNLLTKRSMALRTKAMHGGLAEKVRTPECVDSCMSPGRRGCHDRALVTNLSRTSSRVKKSRRPAREKNRAVTKKIAGPEKGHENVSENVHGKWREKRTKNIAAQRLRKTLPKGSAKKFTQATAKKFTQWFQAPNPPPQKNSRHRKKIHAGCRKKIHAGQLRPASLGWGRPSTSGQSQPASSAHDRTALGQSARQSAGQ